MSDIIHTTYTDKRYLIVDDEGFVLTLMRHLLAELGVENVVCARNGAEALKCLATAPEPFDLVLSDLNMGPVNGLELLKVIRIGYGAIDRATRLVVFTGLLDMGLVPPAINLDVNGFLAKPVSREQMRAALNHAFGSEPHVQNADAYRHVKIPTTPDLQVIACKLGLAHLPSIEVERAAEQTSKSDGAALDLNTVQIQDMVPTEHLAGRILARDIISHDGHLLLAAGVTLSESILNHIINLQHIDQSLGTTIAVVIDDQS